MERLLFEIARVLWGSNTFRGIITYFFISTYTDEEIEMFRLKQELVKRMEERFTST